MATKSKLFVTTDDISPKLFQNPILDFFTRIPWWVPVVIYLPVVIYFYYIGFQLNNPLKQNVITIFIGLFSWTLFEYLVHRFLFHAHPEHPILKSIHYTFHGIHHDYPQDSLRLVMPISVSIPISGILYLGTMWLFNTLKTSNLHDIFYASFMLSYLVYDETHYASHHINWKFKWFQIIKKQHMKHHFVEPDLGFGFTSKIWDLIFRTDFPEKKK